MDLSGPARPRVSRETRLLLVTILISVAALWALARLRFPQRPATPNPVQPLLTQLAAPPAFDDLASEVSKLEPRLLPSLATVGLTVSLRVREDAGAMLLSAPDGSAGSGRVDDPKVLARDPASGLALIGLPGAPAPALKSWSPQQFDRARYLIASDVSRQGASLRPVFIGRLHPTTSPAWPGEIWVLPARTDVAPGDFLFTADAALAGLVIGHSGALTLVPGDTVLLVADRLLSQKDPLGSWLGVQVQALTPSLTSGGDTRPGVMISWVHPDGPAADKLVVMDVIEAVGGEPIASPDDWRARTARLVPDQSIVVRIRRFGATMDVWLTAVPQPAPAGPVTLGLTMRTLTRIGAEVVRIADGSAGARAGIREGDVITAIGEIRTPTASQVARAYDTAPDDRPVLVAITRGDAHRVLALEKK